MSKATFILVPGAWHKPTIYSDVAINLNKHGYSTVLLPLPSAGAKIPVKDFKSDVAAIRSAIESLVIEGKDVVLVVHSYTGLPGGEACKDLGAAVRAAKGLKGGVIRYVVINGFAMPAGFQPAAEGDYSQMPEWMKLDLENDIVTVDAADSKRIFYNDLSDVEGDKFAADLLPQSVGVYHSTATYAAWTDIPSTFLVGDNDQSSISGPLVEMMIQGARAAVPSAFDVVEHNKDAGHCLMISFPEWTANALRRAAGEST